MASGRSLILADDLDVAVNESRVRLGDRNARTVRCAVYGCRLLCAPGTARRLIVDGMGRGYVCPTCERGIIT